MKKENTIFKFDNETNDILELAYSFQKSKALLTALSLGVFDALGEEHRSAEEIAPELNCNDGALERLMNALVSMKILEKKNAKFSNSVNSWNLLVRGNQHFLSNLAYINDLSNAWSNLENVVRSGVSESGKYYNFKNQKELEAYITAMHWRSQSQAPRISQLVNFSKVNRVLDLGGGSGAYSMEFVRTYPHLDVTVYDLPEVIKVTQEYLEVKGFTGRINTIEGDFTKDKLPKNHYDVVFVSLMLHHFSFWECLDILKNIYDSLKLGGKIIIHELLVNDDRTGPSYSAHHSLNLLVNSKVGDVFTESEIWILLKESWFSGIEKIETDFGTGLFIGKR